MSTEIIGHDFLRVEFKDMASNEIKERLKEYIVFLTSEDCSGTIFFIKLTTDSGSVEILENFSDLSEDESLKVIEEKINYILENFFYSKFIELDAAYDLMATPSSCGLSFFMDLLEESLDLFRTHANFVVYKSIEGYDVDSGVYAYNFSLDNERVSFGLVPMETGLSRVKDIDDWFTNNFDISLSEVPKNHFLYDEVQSLMNTILKFTCHDFEEGYEDGMLTLYLSAALETYADLEELTQALYTLDDIMREFGGRLNVDFGLFTPAGREFVKVDFKTENGKLFVSSCNF